MHPWVGVEVHNTLHNKLVLSAVSAGQAHLHANVAHNGQAIAKKEELQRGYLAWFDTIWNLEDKLALRVQRDRGRPRANIISTPARSLCGCSALVPHIWSRVKEGSVIPDKTPP